MTFGDAIYEELKKISAENGNKEYENRCNQAALAEATYTARSTMSRIVHGDRRVSKHLAVQIISALGVNHERAEHMLRLAGYDVSTDGLEENKNYRKIFALGPGHLEEKADLFRPYGDPICRSLRKYPS